MKATGIVRRIDDLGRVVIPKEIRKQMKIREGDPLEIFTDKGMVCLQRYNPIDEAVWAKAKRMADLLLEKYALLDRYEDIQAKKGFAEMALKDYEAEGCLIAEVRTDCEIEAWVIADKSEEAQFKDLVKLLTILCAEEG